MNLTQEQVAAVKQGEPVHLCVPDAGDVVVLSLDVFERLKRLRYDSSDWMAEEMEAAATYSMDDADAGGPIP